MTVFDVVVAAIVSLGPKLSGEAVDGYAADIAFAANGDVELALALVTVQDAESSWRPDIASCKTLGDGGRAAGSFQTHRHWWRNHSQREVCASNRLGAEIAASALTVLSRRGGLTNALRLYVGCGWGDKRAVRRHETLRKLHRLPEYAAFKTEREAA